METNVVRNREIPNPRKLKVAHNALKGFYAPKPKYFIETADVIADAVEVIYIDELLLNSGEFTNEDWLACRIGIDELKAFINNNDLNTYVHDTSDNEGAHVQISGAIPLEIYLDECLRDAVKAYIEAGKEISHV